MKPVDASSELIAAKDALEYVTAELRDEFRAKSLLKTYLSSGRLAAVASAYIRGLDFGPIPTSIPVHETSLTPTISRPLRGLVSLMPHYFTNPGISLYAKELWNWQDSIFAMVEAPSLTMKFVKGQPPTPPARWRHVAYGVKFARSDIDALIDENLPIGKQRASVSKASDTERKRITRLDWPKILADLHELANVGKLEERFRSFSRRGAQADLEHEIARRVVFKRASESTVRRRAVELMKKDQDARATANAAEPN